jgi:DNA-binding SARP family transcriptional activator
MGLHENVIDDLRAIVSIDPSDRDAVRLLADRYYLKEHMEPAYRMYARLEALGSLDPSSRNRIEELRKRLF